VRLTPLAAFTVAACLVAGCGGGGGGDSGSSEDEVKDVTTDYLEAILAEENGRACALTTSPQDCLGQLALAQGFLGEGGFEALLPEDWRDRLDEAEVTFADDDHATIGALSSDDDPTELVREEGRWLIVVENPAGAEGTASVSTDTVATTEEAPEETAGQENARRAAEEYLAYQALSKKGLIRQLKFEGYSTKDAEYAVGAIDVDWNEQAAKAAANYLDNQAFSRSGLVQQLRFEGYTKAQAEYGVSQAYE
jgi:hypothetical protein